MHAVECLGKMTIPTSRLKTVITHLLGLTRNYEKEVDDDLGGLCTYQFFYAAFKALANIPIPEDMTEQVTDVLLAIMSDAARDRETAAEQGLLYDYGAEQFNIPELYYLLNSVTIPSTKIPAVINSLFEHVEHSCWLVRQAVWSLIDRYDLTVDRKNEWIDSKIQRMNHCLATVKPYSYFRSDDNKRIIDEINHIFSILATCTVPREKKQIIIDAAFRAINEITNLNNSQEKCYWTARKACLLIGSCAPLSESHFNDVVVDKLISIIEAHSGVGEAYDALSKFDISEEHLARIAHILLAKLDTRTDYYDVLGFIYNKKLPLTLHTLIANKLIIMVKDNNIEMPRAIYTTLARLTIPADMLEEIVLIMLDRLEDKTRNCWESEYILATLSQINLPSNIKTVVEDKFFSYAIAQIKTWNLLDNACARIAQMRFSTKHSMLIIDKLINAITAGEVHHDRIEGVLECIYELSKNVDSVTIIRIQMILDQIKMKTNNFFIMSLAIVHEKLGQLICQKETLKANQLPGEIAGYILSFMRFNDRWTPASTSDHISSSPEQTTSSSSSSSYSGAATSYTS